MHAIWDNKYLKQELKMPIYKTLIKPIVTYVAQKNRALTKDDRNANAKLSTWLKHREKREHMRQICNARRYQNGVCHEEGNRMERCIVWKKTQVVLSKQQANQSNWKAENTLEKQSMRTPLSEQCDTYTKLKEEEGNEIWYAWYLQYNSINSGLLRSLSLVFQVRKPYFYK